MATIVHVQSARERRNPDGTIKPLHTCDSCSKEITVGSPYKHMSIKTSPTSSRKLIRCADCANWHVWEYSNSTSARCAQIVWEAELALSNADDFDAASDIMQIAADAARELAEEKRESASNIEDGFGHPTQQSEELTELADGLEEWATSMEEASIPDFPTAEDAECETCAGSGEITEEGAKPAVQQCPDCDGKGHPDEVTDEQLDEWRDELLSMSELNDSPA
jgi:hypothetical protein